MKLSLVALILLLLSIPGRSQEIGKQLEELDTLFSRGEYEKAGLLANKIYPKAATSIKNDTVLIEFLNTYGSILYHQQEYAKAATRFSEAAEKSKATLGENEYHFALALFNLAGCYKELGKYVEAEPLYLASLPVLAAAFGQNSLEYTRCFYTLASLYLESARFQEAESMCAAAVNYYKVNPGPTSDDYLGALGTMGVIYQGQSRYDKAEEIFLSLKNYYSSQPSPPKATLQTLENNLGELYRHKGDYQKAEPFLLKAIEMAGPSSLSSAYSLNNLALVQKALGKYAEAEASYKNAISIYKSLGKTEHPDYTNPVNNLGELYRTMGRLQDAVYSFEEVIDLRKRTLGTNHPNYANAVNNLALVEFVLGMYPEAEKHLLECKEIYKKTLGEKDKFYANSINNLASVFKAQGKLSQAEETYKECLRIYKEGYGDSTDKYAIYLGGLAGTYRMMKRYKDAIALTLRSLAILRSKLGVYHYDHVETEYNLAETYREAGLIPEAKKHYLHSMQGFLILIDKYFPYLSEKDKTSFYYNVANAFETFNSFIISLQQQFPAQDHSLLLEKMYNNQVALKSLLLKESEKIRSAISKTTDVLILEKYRQWLQLRETIVQHYRLSTEDQVAKGVNLPGLEKEANELEQSIGIALNVTDKKEPIVSWKEIRDRLQPGEFAVEMIRTDYYNDARWTDTVYYSALIIQKNSEKPSIVIIPGNDLENKNLGNYRKALKAKLGDDLSYIAFWEPLLKSLAGARRIYFSPDGVYQQLNLYTLKDPRSGKYLVDASDLRLVTNTKDILVSGIANTSRKAIIFSNPDFGKTKNSTNAGTNRVTGFPELDDLPGTKMESDSIKKILAQFAWTINEHSRKNATEEAVKRISKPTVLHIATHGYFLKNIKENEGKVMGIQSGIARQNPLLRSGVILAGAAILATDTTAAANADDGILTAYEAAGLDLSTTELVVLSACETGLGEILNGQGVYGLQRAFMVAGARSVIMSLWKIDDLATQQLMVYFYKAWQEDKEGGKQKALRTAQQKLREKYPHPFYWGAFVIVGSL